MTRRPHQIIYTHGGGRLGNQVLRFAHWIAWAMENAGEVEVLNLAFWPHARDFAVWRTHPGCVFPLRAGRADRLATMAPRLWRALEKNSRLPRAVQAAGRRWPGWQAVDLDIVGEEQLALDADFLARVKRRRVTTCCGWEIANWPLVEKHAAAVRELFQPAAEHRAAAVGFISGLRRAHDLVIGVQIRQTDYRAWHDGRFHFSTERYAAWLRDLVALHPDRRVAFVVTSEVAQEPARFVDLPVFFAGGSANAGGDAIRGWAELSLCDLIVSPPSTFSATAAFLGGVPLWPLGAADQAMARDQVFSGGIVAAARHPIFSLAVK
ncbi:MAG: hypothetical protein Q8N18_03100 [Opitutaceae bacterium]|nr:hypothetical protein [Opitutaceae bacterium]